MIATKGTAVDKSTVILQIQIYWSRYLKRYVDDRISITVGMTEKQREVRRFNFDEFSSQSRIQRDILMPK